MKLQGLYFLEDKNVTIYEYIMDYANDKEIIDIGPEATNELDAETIELIKQDFQYIAVMAPSLLKSIMESLTSEENFKNFVHKEFKRLEYQVNLRSLKRKFN